MGVRACSVWPMLWPMRRRVGIQVLDRIAIQERAAPLPRCTVLVVEACPLWCVCTRVCSLRGRIVCTRAYYKDCHRIFIVSNPCTLTSFSGSPTKVILGVYEDGDAVWIHDYHLMVLPKMLRLLKPRCTIGWFLHIPFPTSEIYKVRFARLATMLRCTHVTLYMSSRLPFYTTYSSILFHVCTWRGPNRLSLVPGASE